MDGRMAGWMDGWMDGWTDGRTDGWMDGWMEDGWMVGRKEGCTDGRTRTNERVNDFHFNRLFHMRTQCAGHESREAISSINILP